MQTNRHASKLQPWGREVKSKRWQMEKRACSSLPRRSGCFCRDQLWAPLPTNAVLFWEHWELSGLHYRKWRVFQRSRASSCAMWWHHSSGLRWGRRRRGQTVFRPSGFFVSITHTVASMHWWSVWNMEGHTCNWWPRWSKVQFMFSLLLSYSIKMTCLSV